MSILSKLKNLSSFFPVSLKIGLDLGSSNCRIAIYGKGIVLREPTYVGFDTKNNQYLFFGEEAKQICGKAPSYINIIRPIQNGIISDFEATVALITHFIKKSVFPFFSHEKLLKPNLIAYTTIPSISTEVEQKALEESLLKSGFSRVFLIEKPLASALGAGHPIFSHQPICLVDLGGGLVEVAVIALGGIVIQKTLKLAGEHLNRLISNYLHLKYGLIIGDLTAENLKIFLLNFEEIDQSLIIRGKSLENRLPKSIKVKSNDVKEALVGHFNQIIDMIRDVLEASPPEVIDEIMKQGIVLIGGLAKIKGLKRLFSSDLKLPVNIPEKPEETTINGILKLIKDEDKLLRVIINK